jgi:hypothetical protein
LPLRLHRVGAHLGAVGRFPDFAGAFLPAGLAFPFACSDLDPDFPDAADVRATPAPPAAVRRPLP